MKRVLESSRFLAWVGVLALLVASVAAFAWGAIKTVNVVWLVIESMGKDSGIIVAFIEVIDSFLVSTTMLIFMVSLYELFIGDLDVPEWMVAHNLYELKAKLSSMVVLVMCIKFLQKLLDAKDTNDLMRIAISVTLVSGVLIAFGYFGKKD